MSSEVIGIFSGEPDKRSDYERAVSSVVVAEIAQSDSTPSSADMKTAQALAKLFDRFKPQDS